jgi:putative ABC transport system permease protein
MIAQYVLRGFGRHKARTAIMVLALLVVTVMLVTLNNIVESLQRQDAKFVESGVGEHDITITRAETNPNQTIDVERVSTILRSVDPAVVAIYPRFQATVELEGGRLNAEGPSGGEGVGYAGSASLLARTPEDDLGQVTMLEGTYDLEGYKVVVPRVMADTFALKVGDEIGLSYVLPVSRLAGHDLPSNGSVRRVTRRFTISGIALASGLGGEGQNNVLASVQTVQDWLNVLGQAERLVVVLDEAVYDSMNTQGSVFRVRRIAEKMYDALVTTLGSTDKANAYDFSLAKAQLLDESSVTFAFQRALSGVYGFLVMGVVGLLVYSIVNTNVEERQRDLAFLRVLGAKRRHLFGLVLAEVALIGLIGVGLGIVVGQAFSFLVVVPVANHFIAEGEPGIELQMVITFAAVGRTVVTAVIVLIVSAVAPAYKAASTKIRYAINPGCADSIQIEDLSRLRSRKFDVRILIVGVLLTGMWVPMFISLQTLIAGDESLIAVLMFGGLAVIVIGASLLFFALTVPFERALILVNKAILPGLTFFAGPNLMRAKRRNTMIALMIVFSGTLPTFLGTIAVLEQKNCDFQTRLESGAPVTAQLLARRRPSFVDEFYVVPGIVRAVGITAMYSARVTNQVELRGSWVQVYGITASLADVVYADLAKYAGGGPYAEGEPYVESDPHAFGNVLTEPDAIILSTDYARYMDLNVGDIVRVHGKGKDHVVDMRVVGLIECLPGFQGLYAKGAAWRDNSAGLVSLDTYIRLTHDPVVENVCPQGICLSAEREQPIIARVLATTEGGADEIDVVAGLRKRFSDRSDVQVASTAERIHETVRYMRMAHLLTLAMAGLSFVTSVLGVFAVVYVTVYVRRLEIGMLKAIGMSRRVLVGTFALEAVMLTVSAALAGTMAGTMLGYFFYLTFNLMRFLPSPQHLTFDWLTTMAILIMVVLASVISSSLAARAVVRSKVTTILREAW